MAESVVDRLLALLTSQGATFEVMHHEPVSTSAEAARVRGTPLEQGAKVWHSRPTIERSLAWAWPANLRVDTRGFKRALSVKNLRMIDAGDLLQRFGLEVGAVPPFGHLFGTSYVSRPWPSRSTATSFQCRKQVDVGPSGHCRLCTAGTSDHRASFAAPAGPSV